MYTKNIERKWKIELMAGECRCGHLQSSSLTACLLRAADFQITPFIR